MKSKLSFASVEKKRIYFIPSTYQEIKSYLIENEDAVLIINFSKLSEFENYNCLDRLIELKIHQLLIIGGVENFKIDGLLENEILLELDDRNLNEIPYDFKNFPNLKILRYTWCEKSKNLSTCLNIKELSLWNYKSKNFNLTYFKNMISIEEARFVNSNIKCIAGLEGLKKMKELVLISNNNLSFGDWDYIFKNVESLYIENCKNVDDSFVKFFPNLKKLEFFSKKPLDSIKNILENLPNLEYLNIGETKVMESDNRYWMDYKNLKKLNFLDRKHQLLKSADFKKAKLD